MIGSKLRVQCVLVRSWQSPFPGPIISQEAFIPTPFSDALRRGSGVVFPFRDGSPSSQRGSDLALKRNTAG